MQNTRASHSLLARLGWLFLAAFLLLLSAGCQQASSEPNNEPEEEVVLTFSNTPWPPDALNSLAQEKGFFQKHGVKAEVLWADGYEEAFEQFNSGQLNVMNLTLLDAMTYRAENGSGQVIMVQDYSSGADAVVTFGQMKQITDLKGLKIGAERGTVGEFFLEILLEREDMGLADVEIVDIASEEILNALKKGDIEAGVCYEPCPTDTLNAGGFVMVDSAKERNLIVDVYMAKEDHVNAHKEAYAKALTAIVEAGEYFNAHPEESAGLMKEILKMPEEEILATFEKLRIPSFRENQSAFNRSSGATSLYNLARLAGQYLQDQGLLQEGFDTDSIIHSELMDNITF